MREQTEMFSNYRRHPKDGEDNVFSTRAGGTPVRFPVPSPDSGPMSFLGSTPVLGSMSLLGGTPVLSHLYPLDKTGISPGQKWGTPARTGVPSPGQDWGTPPPRNRLWCGRYTLRGFPQEDFLAMGKIWYYLETHDVTSTYAMICFNKFKSFPGRDYEGINRLTLKKKPKCLDHDIPCCSEKWNHPVLNETCNKKTACTSRFIRINTSRNLNNLIMTRVPWLKVR